MNVVVFPIGLVAIAIGAGLLAVFVVWVSKRIANEQTRSQGITAVALVVGLLVVGVFFTRASFQSHEIRTPQTITYQGGRSSQFAPSTAPGVTGRMASSTTVENGGRRVLHAESNVPAQVYYQEPVAQVAWSRWAMVALAVGGIVLLVASKRSLPAALAALGIIAGLLVMYQLANRSSDAPMARTPSLVPPPASTAPAQPVEKGMLPAGDAGAAEDQSSEVREAEHPSSDAKHGEDLAGQAKSELEKQGSAIRAAVGPTTAAEKNERRPSWIEENPHFDKATGEYRVAINSGPYATEDECDYQLDDKIREAVYRYSDRHLGPRVKYFAYDRDYARQNLIDQRYVETTQSQVLGRPMIQLHVLLKIDSNDRRFFEARYHEAQVRERVTIASTGAAGLLGILGMTYGALRFAGRRRSSAEPPASTPSEAIA